jgi:hypothetical protein
MDERGSTWLRGYNILYTYHEMRLQRGANFRQLALPQTFAVPMILFPEVRRDRHYLLSAASYRQLIRETNFRIFET